MITSLSVIIYHRVQRAACKIIKRAILIYRYISDVYNFSFEHKTIWCASMFLKNNGISDLTLVIPSV